jgi:hypothetical protein
VRARCPLDGSLPFPPHHLRASSFHYGDQMSTGQETKLWEKHKTHSPIILIRMLPRSILAATSPRV